MHAADLHHAHTDIYVCVLAKKEAESIYIHCAYVGGPHVIDSIGNRWIGCAGPYVLHNVHTCVASHKPWFNLNHITCA